MRELIKKYLVDSSDKEQFCFSVACAECGKAMRIPVRFSKAGMRPPTEGKRIVFDVLYQQEWEQAQARAIEEAVHYFNLCPFCGRLVCNECFLICEELDMCRACASSLEELGEPVIAVSAGGGMQNGRTGDCSIHDSDKGDGRRHLAGNCTNDCWHCQ